MTNQSIVSNLTSFHLDVTEAVEITLDKNFDADRAQKWMLDHHTFTIQATIGYLVFIFALKWLMKSREKFTNLAAPLMLWNLILGFVAIYSFVGMTSETLSTLRKEGITAAFCSSSDSFYSGNNGHYVWVYHIIRIFEFGDTIFILLRKQPLIFLHWYHHALTLLAGWTMYPSHFSFMRYFVYVNSAVHSVMYPYFLLSTMKIKMPGFVAQSVTFIQIVQFVGSLVVLGYVTIAKYILETPCDMTIDGFAWNWLMAGSYFYLFTSFYLGKYRGKKTKKD